MPSVLVVDDNNEVRELIAQILTMHGYSVETAGSGVEALQKFRETKPNVVISDVLMPEQGGLQFISELRRENPAAKVIAISGGFKGSESKNIASILGVQHAVAKPFRPEDLLATVRSALA